MRSRWLVRAFPLYVGAVGLLLSGSVQAQVLSKWGHPVITLGQTPYDAVSTGQGNYPGSHGFIPGYGYYPGDLKGNYPWIDGPPIRGKTTYRVPAPETVIPSEALPADCAILRVRMPENGELFISGYRTQQRGTVRLYSTPALDADREQWYELQATWTENGTKRERTEIVRVHPGDRVTVDFLTQSTQTPIAPEPQRNAK